MISLKIETLLEGKVVEKNRVEYKEGWILRILHIQSVRLPMIMQM